MTKTKKVFLAGPFKGIVNPNTGVIDESEKQKILNLISFFEAKGFSVHNAHKREEWGRVYMSPEECTETDFNEIASCDLFVGFPGSPPSPGTHIEIGWASALQKPIILLLEEGREYACLVTGLHIIANVTVIPFKREDDYIQKIESYISVEA